MSFNVHTSLCGLIALIATIGVNAVSPVQRVIALMEKLATQVEKAGKRDAALYDKYACFCKEQADEKLYRIESSNASINDLNAKISALDGEVLELNTGIKDLTQAIEGIEKDIADAKSKRAKEHEKYLKVAESMTFAIESVKKAIESMKESKGQMKGADLDLVQLKAISAMASEASAVEIASLLQAATRGAQAPAKYKYDSNDIIAILSSIKTKFKKYKADLDSEEFHAQGAFDSDVLNMESVKKIKIEERGEKEAVVEEKIEDKSAADENLVQETAVKDAEDALMVELKGQCEAKATEFDTRSKARANEITALTDAVSALKKGASEQWNANKKLVDLSKSVKVTKKTMNVSAAANTTNATMVAKKVAVPSFLQLHRETKDSDVVRKALHVIQVAAGRLHSSVLSAASLKVTLSIDHFVKVREIIKDLVAKLEADASAEADTKTTCDKGMKKNTGKRDENKAAVEKLEADLAVKNAEQKKLSGDVVELGEGIAENAKAMKEMTELWGMGSADNQLTVAQAKEAVAAVESAIAILTGFYKKGEGEQESSKGIIAMLETILADFERTKNAVEAKDAADDKTFEQDKKASALDTEAKQKEKDTKAIELSGVVGAIADIKDKLADSRKLLEESEQALTDFKKMCIDGLTYEDRVESRQEEIAAMKQALNILENWKS